MKKPAFELETIELSVNDILPLKKLSAWVPKSKKYATMVASIREIGIIEPPVVHPGADGKYMLLDGHGRLRILREELKQDRVVCLVATDDEAFTYNHKVNRLNAIQERTMIKKAIDRGVSEARIASALNISVETVRIKRRLLNGICDEAIEILKDRPVTQLALNLMRTVKSTRQIEMAELMVSADDFTGAYARALQGATPDAQRLDGGNREPKPEDLSRLEREMHQVEREFVQLEESYGQNVVNLVLASKYLTKLLNSGRVVQYLHNKQPAMLEEFQHIVEATSLDA